MEQANIEVWKDIDCFDGYYEVSNKGRIRTKERKVWNGKGYVTLKPKILKQAFSHKGYKICYLSKYGKQRTLPVHRLVAKAFIENNLNKPQVNHNDGNKTNNVVENLEWCTNSENQRHAFKLGLNKVSGKTGKPKKPVIKCNPKTEECIERFDSITAAAKSIGYSSESNIGACCRGLRRTVGGFVWKYESEVLRYE